MLDKPFDLKNPAPTVQCLMDAFLRSCPFISLADILIFSNTRGTLRTSLLGSHCFDSNDLHFSLTKCTFVVSEVDFLGHHVTSKSLSPFFLKFYLYYYESIFFLHYTYFRHVTLIGDIYLYGTLKRAHLRKHSKQIGSLREHQGSRQVVSGSKPPRGEATSGFPLPASWPATGRPTTTTTGGTAGVSHVAPRDSGRAAWDPTCFERPRYIFGFLAAVSECYFGALMYFTPVIRISFSVADTSAS